MASLKMPLGHHQFSTSIIIISSVNSNASTKLFSKTNLKLSSEGPYPPFKRETQRFLFFMI